MGADKEFARVQRADTTTFGTVRVSVFPESRERASHGSRSLAAFSVRVEKHCLQRGEVTMRQRHRGMLSTATKQCREFPKVRSSMQINGCAANPTWQCEHNALIHNEELVPPRAFLDDDILCYNEAGKSRACGLGLSSTTRGSMFSRFDSPNLWHVYPRLELSDDGGTDIRWTPAE
eukprot:4091234-Prymnesium_polylepis.5